MPRGLDRLLSVRFDLPDIEENTSRAEERPEKSSRAEERPEKTKYSLLKRRSSLHYPMSKYLMNSSEREDESIRSGASDSKRSSSGLNKFEFDIEDATESTTELYEDEDDISVALTVFQHELNSPFFSEFDADEMRCLALVAHNHMKPAMKSFIETHSEILKKFRLVGTNTTMTMCKTVFGENNPDVLYGPECTSGPLGGDAQLCALMCREDVGGVIFFIDPLSPHPHQADIDSLIRLCNVHNVLFCSNPTSAISMMHLLRHALMEGKKEMMASFFQTLESPSVPEYKAAQKRALDNAIAK